MSAILVRHSPIHGTGVFASRDIPEGEEIIYYEGRLITHDEADEGSEDDGHTFLFTLNDLLVIDGGAEGNEARWINHSCEPNCEPWLVEDEDGDPTRDRVVIQASRLIRAGEELSYDYGITTDDPLDTEERALWTCRCGSPRCKGTLLDSPASTEARAAP